MHTHSGRGQFPDHLQLVVGDDIVVEDEPRLQKYLLLFDGRNLHEGVHTEEVPTTHSGAFSEFDEKMDESRIFLRIFHFQP